MDCSLPGFSVHRIFQARVLEWGAIAFSGSVAQSCPTLCDPVDCSTPGPLSITNSQSLLKLMSIELMMLPNHLILYILLLLLPLMFLSIRVFPNKSALRIEWPKYWSSASASVLPMNIQHWFPWGLTGWISLQSKGLSRVFSSTEVQKHQLFGAQLSLWFNFHIVYDYWKTIALTIWTFVSNVMSPLFNTLSRFVIAFLPRRTVF